MVDHHCIQMLQLSVFLTRSLKEFKLEHILTSTSILQVLKDYLTLSLFRLLITCSLLYKTNDLYLPQEACNVI